MAKVIRRRLPNRRPHTLLAIEASSFRNLVGIGHYDNGQMAEIFSNAEKGGTAIDDAARNSTVVACIALQHGVDSTLQHALMRNSSGTALGALGVLLDILAAEDPSDMA